MSLVLTWMPSLICILSEAGGDCLTVGLHFCFSLEKVIASGTIPLSTRLYQSLSLCWVSVDCCKQWCELHSQDSMSVAAQCQCESWWARTAGKCEILLQHAEPSVPPAQRPFLHSAISETWYAPPHAALDHQAEKVHISTTALHNISGRFLLQDLQDSKMLISYIQQCVPVRRQTLPPPSTWMFTMNEMAALCSK